MENKNTESVKDGPCLVRQSQQTVFTCFSKFTSRTIRKFIYLSPKNTVVTKLSADSFVFQMFSQMFYVELLYKPWDPSDKKNPKKNEPCHQVKCDTADVTASGMPHMNHSGTCESFSKTSETTDSTKYTIPKETLGVIGFNAGRMFWRTMFYNTTLRVTSLFLTGHKCLCGCAREA